MEQLLHYLWQHKIFPLKQLTTTEGLPVEVVDVGLHNTDAGPDFFNAKLKIGGVLWVGNVEIHRCSSDWRRHGHDTDPAYDNVILHVVAVADEPVRRLNGELIPQMLLECPRHVSDNYTALLGAELSPACFPIIAALPKITVHGWMSALQIERLERKTAAIRLMLQRHGGNWEECLFVLMARYMGMGLNSDAFEAWGDKLPLRAADKVRDDLRRLEALFFGTAGLLDGEATQDGYRSALDAEFRYMRHLYSVDEPLSPSRWRMFRTRPCNFPHVRIAQMAWLYHHQRAIFSKVMEAEDVEALRRLFHCETSPYWDTHYRFGKEAPERKKHLGKGIRDIIIINAAIPMMYAYAIYRGDEALRDKASRLLDAVPAENNCITRMWEAAGITPLTAADSQALIELRREYCEKKKCLYCRFGYEYLVSRRACGG